MIISHTFGGSYFQVFLASAEHIGTTFFDSMKASLALDTYGIRRMFWLF